jgi:hypothetical protein
MSALNAPEPRSTRDAADLEEAQAVAQIVAEKEDRETLALEARIATLEEQKNELLQKVQRSDLDVWREKLLLQRELDSLDAEARRRREAEEAETARQHLALAQQAILDANEAAVAARADAWSAGLQRFGIAAAITAGVTLAILAVRGQR